MLVSWGGGRMSKDLICLPLDYKIKSNFAVMKVEFVLKASGTIVSMGHSPLPVATGRRQDSPRLTYSRSKVSISVHKLPVDAIYFI